MELYRSPYEAYPFLCENSDDLRCDFELLTDLMASGTGLLRAQVQDEPLRAELAWVCELIYHANPGLRTRLAVTGAERDRLLRAVQRLQTLAGERCRRFVLPAGCQAACTAHVLRVQAKQLVRLLYRHLRQGHTAEPLLIDIANLLSGYFFSLALWLNQQSGTDEIAFVSRNY